MSTQVKNSFADKQNILESLTPCSCSISRMFNKASMKRGCSSAYATHSKLMQIKRVGGEEQYIFQVELSLTTDVGICIKRSSYPLAKIDGHACGKEGDQVG